MIFIKNRFLLLPFLLIASVFAFDSVFGLKSLEDMRIHWMKVEPPVYQSREKVFRSLTESWPQYQKEGKKAGIILGSSRSAEYSSRAVAEVLPDSVTYNFSAPLAPPSHFYYWLDRVLKAGIRPAFVFIEADALVFTPDSVNYSLSYSYDPVFVLSHTDLFRNQSASRDIWQTDAEGFSFDETETFLLKRLFSLYRYPFDLRVIEENRKEFLIFAPEGPKMTTGLAFREFMQNNIDAAVIQEHGGIPNMMQFTNPLVNIDRNAKEIYDRYRLSSFKASPTQVAFFRKLTRRLAEERIPFVVNQPVMSDVLFRMLEKTEKVQQFHKGLYGYLNSLKSDFPDSVILITDYQKNPEFQCRDFADSYHLSGACYTGLGKMIMQELISQSGGL